MLTAGHDRGAVLGDGDAAGLPQLGKAGLVQGHGLVFAHDRGAGEYGDVAKHGLAAIPEARSPYGCNLQYAPVFVDHQGGESFALHFFRQDQQGSAALGNRLQHGHQVSDGADFAVGDQDQGIFKDAFAPLLVGDEVGGAVATVEGHALGDLQFGG